MRVRIVETRWIEVKKAARERLAKCSELDLCVACMEPVVEGERTLRGCHMRCYHATYRAIRSGKFTESARVEAGKLLEPSENGRKPSNPVSVEAG